VRVKKVAFVAIIAAVILAVSWFGWTAVSRTRPPAQDETGAAAATTPAAYSQTCEKGGVTVTATLLSPAEAGPDRLSFRLALETHAGDLMAYDPARGARLMVDGRPIQVGFTWTPESESSHHRYGILSLPARDDKGNPYVGQGTTRLELSLRGIKGEEPHVLRWGQPELTKWREEK